MRTWSGALRHKRTEYIILFLLTLSYLIYESVLISGLHRTGPASPDRVHRFRDVDGPRQLKISDGHIARDNRTCPAGAGAAVHHVGPTVGLHVRPGLHDERQHRGRVRRHALHGPTSVPQVRHVAPKVRLQVLADEREKEKIKLKLHLSYPTYKIYYIVKSRHFLGIG